MKYLKLQARFTYTGVMLENLLPIPRGVQFGSSLATWDLTNVTALKLPSGTTIGGSSLTALGTITSTSANALAVGANGTTNPAFNVDASASSVATGINVAGAAAAAGVTMSALSSGSNENIIISPKGTGLMENDTPIDFYTPVAVNSTTTLTAAQVLSGYITSTSAAAVTMTLPTGTTLGNAILGCAQGFSWNLYIDNTAGANTITMAVNTNAILSAAAAAGSGAGAGLLTVPSGVTGVACFNLMFTSATAYAFSRTA
jgi:hypothetical protein